MSVNVIAYFTPRADGWHVYFGRMARLAGVFETPDEAEAEVNRLQREWEAGRITDDGHVIAAAPDLLAACEAAVAYDEAIQRYAAHGESWVEGDDLDALYNDWITKSRAAIAKVRGAQGRTDL